MKIFFFSISAFVLLSCGNQSGQTGDKSDLNDKSKENFQVSEQPEELLVKENCVVFIVPSQAEIDSMQANMDEDSYNEMIFDMSWYNGLVQEFLDSFNIRFVNCRQNSIILISNKNDGKVLRRNEINGDMIMHNPVKSPVITSAIDFNKNQVLEYFDK